MNCKKQTIEILHFHRLYNRKDNDWMIHTGGKIFLIFKTEIGKCLNASESIIIFAVVVVPFLLYTMQYLEPISHKIEQFLISCNIVNNLCD